MIGLRPSQLRTSSFEPFNTPDSLSNHASSTTKTTTLSTARNEDDNKSIITSIGSQVCGAGSVWPLLTLITPASSTMAANVDNVDDDEDHDHGQKMVDQLTTAAVMIEVGGSDDSLQNERHDPFKTKNYDGDDNDENDSSKNGSIKKRNSLLPDEEEDSEEEAIYRRRSSVHVDSDKVRFFSFLKKRSSQLVDEDDGGGVYPAEEDVDQKSFPRERNVNYDDDNSGGLDVDDQSSKETSYSSFPFISKLADENEEYEDDDYYDDYEESVMSGVQDEDESSEFDFGDTKKENEQDETYLDTEGSTSFVNQDPMMDFEDQLGLGNLEPGEIKGAADIWLMDDDNNDLESDDVITKPNHVGPDVTLAESYSARAQPETPFNKPDNRLEQLQSDNFEEERIVPLAEKQLIGLRSDHFMAAESDEEEEDRRLGW